MTATCAQCGGAVTWSRESGSGRWRCFNAGTQVDHWDQCSKRRWQQVKATGTRFVTKNASGYAKSIHGTKYDRISAGVFTGKDYRPVQHTPNCAAAPWEECACPDHARPRS